MQELALKMLILLAWNLLSRAFSPEFRARLLSLMAAMADLDMPGSAKFDLLREFGKQSLQNITPILSAAMSMFITTAFGMLQAQGQSWIEKQIGGSIDAATTQAQLMELIERKG